MDVLVHLSIKHQVGGFKGQIEDGTDLIHTEAGSLRQHGIILQRHPDRQESWNLSEQGHHVERY